MEGSASNEQFGYSVAGAGDINADEYADVIIGGWGSEKTYIFLGGPGGLSTTPVTVLLGEGYPSQFGYAVTGVGDVNADGFSDVEVGAPSQSGNRGRAYVYLGGPSGLAPAPVWWATGDFDGDLAGVVLSPVGDLNGDGFAEVAISEMYYGAFLDGQVSVYYGGRSHPHPPEVQRPRQQKSTGTPLALLGASDQYDRFRVVAAGRTAAGRARVRLEWNAAPLNTALGSLSLQSGGWTDTGTPADSSGSRVTLTQQVTGLQAAQPYHWRARVAGNSPRFPHGIWLSVSPGVPSLEQFRTPADPADVVDQPNLTPATDLAFTAVQPNPFSASASLHFPLPRAGEARLGVYDAAGRRVIDLVTGLIGAGQQAAVWNGLTDDGKPAPAGVYFARLEWEGRVATQKLTVRR